MLQPLSLFSTIAQFGTADDIALADLRIEFGPAIRTGAHIRKRLKSDLDLQAG
ncbi:MAG: hypothetical protein V3S26_07255 [Acidimicrobiia bacterium]